MEHEGLNFLYKYAFTYSSIINATKFINNNYMQLFTKQRLIENQARRKPDGNSVLISYSSIKNRNLLARGEYESDNTMVIQNNFVHGFMN